MSIFRHSGNPFGVRITDSASMLEAVRAYGFLPFFENAVPGFSVEELTPPSCWLSDEQLGPWDWKVDLVQSGEIVYGKFLCGGKAAFATVPWYAHLRAWRLSQEKYAPTAEGEQVLALVDETGSCVSRQVRERLGVRKSRADAVLAALMRDCRLVIGDIQRVYRGPNLEYKGWQTASYCRPESVFERPDETFGPWKIKGSSLQCDCSPEASFEKLRDHVLTLFPGADAKSVLKVLG